MPSMTKVEFLKTPSLHWYSDRRNEIRDDWFINAWRTEPAFRDTLTYEMVRSVSKASGDWKSPRNPSCKCIGFADRNTS